MRTAVLHHKQTSSHVPDYHAQRIVKWRWITYPWAIVEDLTVLASRMTPHPQQADELKGRLIHEIGLEFPGGIIEQVAPIVLQRLAEALGERGYAVSQSLLVQVDIVLSTGLP